MPTLTTKASAFPLTNKHGLKDFSTEHLTGKAKEVADLIVRTMCEAWESGDINGGGQKAFYSPKEWKEKGEKFGEDATLIVTYDGGDAYCFFSDDEDTYRSQDAMLKALDKAGYTIEPINSWCAAIEKN